MPLLLDPATVVRLDELVTIPELAQLAGIHPTVVQYYIRRDDLPVYRLGKSWVLRACDAENFMVWHSRQASAAPEEGVRRRPGRPARSRRVPGAA